MVKPIPGREVYVKPVCGLKKRPRGAQDKLEDEGRAIAFELEPLTHRLLLSLRSAGRNRPTIQSSILHILNSCTWRSSCSVCQRPQHEPVTSDEGYNSAPEMLYKRYRDRDHSFFFLRYPRADIVLACSKAEQRDSSTVTCTCGHEHPQQLCCYLPVSSFADPDCASSKLLTAPLSSLPIKRTAAQDDRIRPKVPGESSRTLGRVPNACRVCCWLGQGIRCSRCRKSQ